MQIISSKNPTLNISEDAFAKADLLYTESSRTLFCSILLYQQREKKIERKKELYHDCC